MSFRNDKRKAAITILKILIENKPGKVIPVGMDIPASGTYIAIDKKTYDHYTLNELSSLIKYNKKIIKSAIDLLIRNNHIDYMKDEYRSICKYSNIRRCHL